MEPEDLLGDACLVLITRSARVDRDDDRLPASEVTDVVAFLRGTMRIVAKTRGRRWNEHEIVTFPCDEPDLFTTQSLPGCGVIKAEDWRALQSGLRRLDAFSRDVVVAHGCRELSLAEIADRHGRTVNAARMTYQRALKRLRRWMRAELLCEPWSSMSVGERLKGIPEFASRSSKSTH